MATDRGRRASMIASKDGQPSGALKAESKAACTDVSTGARRGSRIETAAFSGMLTLILPLPYLSSTIVLIL
jgi:hypothetical protein